MKLIEEYRCLFDKLISTPLDVCTWVRWWEGHTIDSCLILWRTSPAAFLIAALLNSKNFSIKIICLLAYSVLILFPYILTLYGYFNRHANWNINYSLLKFWNPNTRLLVNIPHACLFTVSFLYVYAKLDVLLIFSCIMFYFVMSCLNFLLFWIHCLQLCIYCRNNRSP